MLQGVRERWAGLTQKGRPRDQFTGAAFLFGG